MRHLFVTHHAASARWLAAFPELEIVAPEDALSAVGSEQTLCWLDLSSVKEGSEQLLLSELLERGLMVVVMSAVPSDSEAAIYLTSGAAGYCHLESVPQQLQDIAGVVEKGGYWMPSNLLQQLVSLVSSTTAKMPAAAVDFSDLTVREYEVAQLVGRGLSNREIAEFLGVTERTIKSHLTIVFDKLGIRDRVKLALMVNSLPIH